MRARAPAPGDGRGGWLTRRSSARSRARAKPLLALGVRAPPRRLVRPWRRCRFVTATVSGEAGIDARESQELPGASGVTPAVAKRQGAAGRDTVWRQWRRG